ncbi:hypothetical protein GQ43DRAFT_453320 [Delitschia confertaspora ATCC 74209]|uniref:Major facilitator superfamily (MFS) profile domain-containing protein n=1 Tax=Delitschia confertaspora ATCC 74209 TaxID=1513339 RepID=A0A9P4JTZ2_9PLEO|nr:hypothetical protein GQ43DRAFT_453320 [Delitschia confertaspora ATCC 74209]
MLRAIANVWSTSHMIVAYILIFIINFVQAMQQGMSFSLTPYLTSSFSLDSLTATTSIMSSLIGGIFKLPLAKILDIWGRPQGFALMVLCMLRGLIMMAGCQNVQTYAAAQVFYWVGYNGMSYTLGIFVADTSSLKNRGFMFAFISSPYIAIVWITGPMAKAFLAVDGPGWRWGYGTFTIVVFAVTFPLYALFMWNYRKAKNMGLIVNHKSNRTFLELVKYYTIEFDLAGIFLLAIGLALFLLPFSLYSYQGDGWKSSMIICMLVFGVVFLIVFALYEKFIAPKTFIPFDLLVDRTVMGACVLAAVLFVSFLQVVNGLSITKATYALVTEVSIRWTGRFKWLALYFGVPVTILGVALMANFRQPDVHIGYVVMCQIFIAFSGGTLVICEQMAVMAAASHQHLAVVLAVEAMFSSIGGAIGSTVAAAVWRGVFPKRLQRYLPEESKADWATIYRSITAQLSYPKGTATRHAIERAYGDVQKYMIAGGSSVLVLAIISVVVWRDIKVKDFKQAKGRVV